MARVGVNQCKQHLTYGKHHLWRDTELFMKHMGPEGYFIATKKSKETALQDLSWVFW